jgi:hypothetical protein
MLRFQLSKALSSKPAQHLAVDEDSDPDVFVTPLNETEPLIPKDTTTSSAQNCSHDSDEAASQIPKAERLSISPWPLNKSASDLNLKGRSRQHNSSMNTTDSRQTIFRGGHNNRGSDSGTKTPQNIPTIIFPAMFPASQKVRRSLRRSASNPGPEITKSNHHDPKTDSATLQKRLTSQTNHTGRPPSNPERVRCVRTATGPFQWVNPQAPATPGFKWYPLRSNSDPSSTPQVKYRAGRVGKNLPLKPCMKDKSKIAATTPPNEFHELREQGSRPQTLRRVKTVDFEDDASRKLLALPPLKVWTPNFIPITIASVERSKAQGGTGSFKLTKAAPRVTSCPGSVTKSVVAEPAVTRTDVHVVAIAPSWDIGDVPDGGSIDSATPTMQIVESKGGCYEVVWDDVPLEHDIRLHRRGSSASQALVAVSPEFPRGSHGLERVNTKLTEWTFNEGKSAELFKPQIVVFPDGDGRAPHFDCVVEDGKDFMVIAPPNSERTSTTPSRHHSRPASARRCKSDSFADDEAPTDEDTFEEQEYKQNTLAIPDPNAPNNRPGHLVGSHRRVRKPPSLRRLSNMDESDLRFRGHRDSVTLARKRILNADNVSSELFISTMPAASPLTSHRDSVSIAKKRMHSHNRNYAISSARGIPQSKVTASDPSHPIDDLDQAIFSHPASSAANKALKSSSSASMLLPQPIDARHIRIVE